MKDDYMNDKWITRGYSNGYSDDKWITRGYSNGYSDKYSVIYKSSSGLCDDYRRQYTLDGSFETLETDEEKSARLLKEKAVKRNDKIDKLLENGGL